MLPLPALLIDLTQFRRSAHSSRVSQGAEDGLFLTSETWLFDIEI
jgi:hypothetical protein